MDGIPQVDLVGEAVWLCGPTDSFPALLTSKSLMNLQSSPNPALLLDPISPCISSNHLDRHENETLSRHETRETGTMWVDFLFDLRRHII